MTKLKPKAKLKLRQPRLPRFSPLCLWLMLIGAFCMWLGFPNDFIQLPALVFLWPLCLLFLGRSADNARQALARGWLCSFCGMLAVMYWLALPVHNVGALPLPGAIACAMLICGALAFQGGIFSLLAFLCPCRSPLALSVCLAFSWSLLEFFFALIGGFPWIPLAGALADRLWMAQGAAISGAFGLSAIWLAAIFSCVLAFPQTGLFLHVQVKEGWHWRNCALLFFGALMLGCLAIYGNSRLNANTDDFPENGFNVLMAQGNIDQNQKWLPAFQRKSLNAYMSLTREGLERDFTRDDMPLVIWPETALPFFIEASMEWQAELVNFVRRIDCPLLFGAPGIERTSDGAEKIYNRAFLLDANGQFTGHYDKVHLVPFGEYAPEWLKFDFLEALLQGVGVYSEGQSASPLRLGRLALGMLICYEGIFPWLAQERAEAGANVLVDISNDGWFGDSPAPRQHLMLTLLRCIEQNRWLVRATNTGISAIVDNYGRARLEGPQFQAAFLVGRSGLETEHTFYFTYGKWLPWIALFCVCLLWIASYLAKKKA